MAVTLPLRTVPGLNAREMWQVRSRAAGTQFALWQLQRAWCACCTSVRVSGPALRCSVTPLHPADAVIRSQRNGRKGAAASMLAGRKVLAYCIDARAAAGACGPQALLWEAAA